MIPIFGHSAIQDSDYTWMSQRFATPIFSYKEFIKLIWIIDAFSNSSFISKRSWQYLTYHFKYCAKSSTSNLLGSVPNWVLIRYLKAITCRIGTHFLRNNAFILLCIFHSCNDFMFVLSCVWNNTKVICKEVIKKYKFSFENFWN